MTGNTTASFAYLGPSLIGSDNTLNSHSQPIFRIHIGARFLRPAMKSIVAPQHIATLALIASEAPYPRPGIPNR